MAEPGEVQGFDHLDTADASPVDRTVAESSADDDDAPVLPGGVANPDRLRTDAAAVTLVRDVSARGKPVAAICHTPWTPGDPDAFCATLVEEFGRGRHAREAASPPRARGRRPPPRVAAGPRWYRQ